ncbi:MAG: hypothetical protein ACYDCQ_00810 [Dehalococcoidia bacterium]
MTAHHGQGRSTQQELLAESDRLYEQFAKPLEAEHWGEFVAIAPDGRSILGETANQVGRAAMAAFGPGNFVFKIGPRVSGKWL